jgi:hypothetical protein
VHQSENILQSDNGKLLMKLLPLSVTASVQPVGQGAIETVETHYKGQLLQKHADEGIDIEMFGCS